MIIDKNKKFPNTIEETDSFDEDAKEVQDEIASEINEATEIENDFDKNLENNSKNNSTTVTPDNPNPFDREDSSKENSYEKERIKEFGEKNR